MISCASIPPSTIAIQDFPQAKVVHLVLLTMKLRLQHAEPSVNDRRQREVCTAPQRETRAASIHGTWGPHLHHVRQIEGRGELKTTQTRKASQQPKKDKQTRPKNNSARQTPSCETQLRRRATPKHKAHTNTTFSASQLFRQASSRACT